MGGRGTSVALGIRHERDLKKVPCGFRENRSVLS